MLLITLLNFLTLKSLATYGFGQRFTDGAPFVSILVPARNEAGNIAKCIRSLLKQDYPYFEVIVLDDYSEDATFSILEMLRLPSDDPQGRLRLLRGKELPPGWLGKNWACHQLASAARGDYLLFTDADTWHSPNALHSAMAALFMEDAQFLSIFPRQEISSFAERLAVPLVLKFYIYGLLPTWLVARSPRRAFSAANGQFMLFQYEVYQQIGGHEAIRKTLLEDVALGRLVKKSGYKTLLPDGRDSVICRMYRSSLEVWLGFSKNLFAFFNHNLFWLLIFLVFNWLAFLAPYGWLLAGWLRNEPASLEWCWLPLAQIGLGLLMRFLISVREGFNPLDAFLQPFSILYGTAIAFNSVRWYKQGGEWKGRKVYFNGSDNL